MLFILEDNDERIENFQMVMKNRSYHIEKTVPESIEWLRSNFEEIKLYSLDNDLIVPEYEGEEGEGWELCEWIIQNCPKKPIIIHTTNSYASTKMKMACEENNWKYHWIVPFNGFEWIPTVWATRVNFEIEES